MTVGQLIDRLRALPEEALVVVYEPAMMGECDLAEPTPRVLNVHVRERTWGDQYRIAMRGGVEAVLL